MNSPYLETTTQSLPGQLNYFNLFYGHRKWIIVLAVVIAFVVIKAGEKAPIYSAQATILISSDSVISPADSLLANYNRAARANFFLNQRELLTSRQLIEKTIAALELNQHPAFVLDLLLSKDAESIRQHTINQFRQNLYVENITNSSVIKISFTTTDSVLAAQIVNTLIAIYADSIATVNTQVIQRSIQTISDSLADSQQKLSAAEVALQSFINENNLVEPNRFNNVINLKITELNDLNKRVDKATERRWLAEQNYQQVAALRAETDPKRILQLVPGLASQPAINNAIQAKENALQAQAEIRLRYAEKHPQAIAAANKLKQADIRLSQQLLAFIATSKENYEESVRAADYLREQQAIVQQDLERFNHFSYQLKRLQNDFKSSQSLYQQLLDDYKKLTTGSSAQSYRVEVIDPAEPPLYPLPQGSKSLIILILSLISAVLLVFLTAYFDNTLRQPSDIESRLALPLLGVLPRLSMFRKRELKVLRHYADHTDTVFAESIRAIRTAVLCSPGSQTILVTSPSAADGKTTVAVNLALSLAPLHNVLLLDANLRQPKVSKAFALDDMPGLTDLLAGTHVLEQVLYRDKQTALCLLPAGTLVENPLDLLSIVQFKELWKLLKTNYDYIIVDSPALLIAIDALLLAELVDKTIYLITANKTQYPKAVLGLKQLQQRNISCVFNQCDLEPHYYLSVGKPR